MFDRKRILLVAFAGVLVLGTLFAACAQQGEGTKPGGTQAQPPKTEQQAAKPKALALGTSSVGGAYYAISVGMGEIISKKTGIGVTAEAVGGSDANVRALKDRKVDFAMLNAGSVADGLAGKGTFAKDGKIPLRVLAQGQESLRQVVVRNASGIKTVADLKGKKFIARRKSLQELEQVADALFKAYGVPKDSVTILETAETNEAIEALKLGTADAAVIPGGVPAGFLTELAQSADVTFLPIPDDKLEATLKELGLAFHKASIPAGTYKGQDQEVSFPALSTELAALADMPEETAYLITKTLLDSPEDLKAVHSSGKDWTVANSLKVPPAPFHPGAIKYYKEKGAWTPELDKIQETLLRQQ